VVLVSAFKQERSCSVRITCIWSDMRENLAGWKALTHVAEFVAFGEIAG
jgi:hypothetical protein